MKQNEKQEKDKNDKSLIDLESWKPIITYLDLQMQIHTNFPVMISFFCYKGKIGVFKIETISMSDLASIDFEAGNIGVPILSNNEPTNYIG